MGRDGAMPWHLPADLRHFRRVTGSKPVVMGRKTHDSIGKPLPGRRNIVLTHNREYTAPGVEIAHSVDEVLTMTADAQELAVIGGAQIFDAFAPYVDEAFVTLIDAEVKGDVYYREPGRTHARTLLATHAVDERNAYAMSFYRDDYETAAVTGGSVNESKPSA